MTSRERQASILSRALMDSEADCARLKALLRELVDSQAINMAGPREEWPITGAQFADLYTRVHAASR